MPTTLQDHLFFTPILVLFFFSRLFLSYLLHIAVYSFSQLPVLFKREKEKSAAAVPMGKRRGSRFKSRIFRRRKAARLLKASKKKNAPFAILFKLAPFSISWGDREAPFASSCQRDAGGMRSRRRVEREVLITRRRTLPGNTFIR